MAKFAVIVPAAGKSSRFGDKEKKPFINLDGRAIWLRTLELFINDSNVGQCLVVIAPEDEELFRRRFGANLAFMDVTIVLGGAERFESVANALDKLKSEIDFVAIHDAVRPCISRKVIESVFARAQQTGAAIAAVPVADTVKEAASNHEIARTVSRKGLWLAQTPQVFRRDWLADAYARRSELGTDITDDAQLVEAAGHKVTLVESTSTNIKITTRQDLLLAEAILKSQPKPKPGGFANPFSEEEMWGGRGLK